MSILAKKCCLTGHRPKGFPWNYRDKNCTQHKAYLAELKRIVLELIKQNGYNYFISGCAIGADMDFAEVVLELKKQYPTIKLEAAIPCPNQDLKWSQEDKARYAAILARADARTLVSPTYNYYCMQRRNEYMVDNSETVICVWNGERSGGTYNTIRYTSRLLQILLFHISIY